VLRPELIAMETCDAGDVNLREFKKVITFPTMSVCHSACSSFGTTEKTAGLLFLKCDVAKFHYYL
jgi:hypothetical protein